MLFRFGSRKSADPEQARKERTEKILKSRGIAVNPHLPVRFGPEDALRRDLDAVCRRVAAGILVIQLACDAANGDYDPSREALLPYLERFGVLDALNAPERKLLDGDYTQQSLSEIVWTYESCWALEWALGLIDDISDASDICECEKAVRLVADGGSMEDFRAKCALRDLEELKDMTDYYYRCHWAAVEKRLRPETRIGDLNEEVVMERRRGLDWLFDPEDDWFDISLDT